MKNILSILLFMLLQISLFSESKWEETTLKDPFTGDLVKSYDIKVMKQNFYLWPSKFDGIYWPHTDPHYIAFNPSNGYVDFIPTFENPPQGKIKQIKEVLAKDYHKSKSNWSHYDKVAWWGKLHIHKETKLFDKIQHECLLSYLSRKDKSLSNAHKKEALILLKEYLVVMQYSSQYAMTLTTTGFYEYILGNRKEAMKHFEKSLKLPLNNLKGDNVQRYRDHLKAMHDSIIDGSFEKEYLKGNPKI